MPLMHDVMEKGIVMRVFLCVVFALVVGCGSPTDYTLSYDNVTLASPQHTIAIPLGQEIEVRVRNTFQNRVEWRVGEGGIIDAKYHGGRLTLSGLRDWFDEAHPEFIPDGKFEPSTFVFPIVNGQELYDRGFTVRAVVNVTGSWSFSDADGPGIIAKMEQAGSQVVLLGFPEVEFIGGKHVVNRTGEISADTISFPGIPEIILPPMSLKLSDRGVGTVEFVDEDGYLKTYDARRID
jgi:hypothetical protein